jgi:hypothetical protein
LTGALCCHELRNALSLSNAARIAGKCDEHTDTHLGADRPE